MDWHIWKASWLPQISQSAGDSPFAWIDARMSEIWFECNTISASNSTRRLANVKKIVSCTLLPFDHAELRPDGA
jgi:hypothetical protein